MAELIRNYVDGRFVGAGRTFQDINPVDGSVAAEVCEATETEIDQAVQAARVASKGTWGHASPARRADCLEEIAAGIERRFDAFVAAEVRDTGRTVRQARTLDVPRAIANFRFFASLVKTAHTDAFETETAGGERALNYTVRKPLGVVAAISPWNLPILLFSWKVAPALALGNAVVAKPSEETPSSAALLAEVVHETRLPAGAFNVLQGSGATAGQALIGHPDIDAVTFTGASATGAHIMQTVAHGVKDISFELGGKNAAIVFADADFEAAVDGVVKSTFTNCGQVCLCTERVLVQRPIFERFVAALKARTEALVLGVPDDPNSDMGPSAMSRPSTPKRRRLRAPTTPSMGWLPPSGPRISSVRIEWRRRCAAAWSGSIPGFCATCGLPSGVYVVRASAARAGAIPWTSIRKSPTSASACREASRAKAQGHVGVQIGNHVGDRDLDDAQLIEFLHHCAVNDIPVLVHPWDMMGGAGRMRRWMLPWLVAMPAETSLSILSLILSGAFERLPRSLRLCFAHGGGSFAFTLGRSDNAWKCRDIVRQDCPNPPSSYTDRFSVDSAVFDHRALRLLVEVMGCERVMLGSDYPYPLGEQQIGQLVASADFLSAPDRQAILTDNARQFFNLRARGT